MPTYPVPTSIKDVAQNAIDQNMSLPLSQRAAYKDEGDKRIPGTGMRTARRLISGRVDYEQLILMRAWFARHGKSDMEREKRKDKTSKASIAWRLWGGTGAVGWVNQLIRQIEREKNKE